MPATATRMARVEREWRMRQSLLSSTPLPVEGGRAVEVLGASEAPVAVARAAAEPPGFAGGAEANALEAAAGAELVLEASGKAGGAPASALGAGIGADGARAVAPGGEGSGPRAPLPRSATQA